MFKYLGWRNRRWKATGECVGRYAGREVQGSIDNERNFGTESTRMCTVNGVVSWGV